MAHKHYELNLRADFTEPEQHAGQRIRLNVNYLPALQFKFGHFKQLFRQEQFVTTMYIDSVERLTVNNLVPAYSPGVQLWDQFLKGTVEYRLGAFNGKSFLNVNDQSTPKGVLRFRFYPWRSRSVPLVKGYAFGGAVPDGRTLSRSGFTDLMPTGTFTFFKPEKVNGGVIGANGGLTWTPGPAAPRAEYVQTNLDR